MAERNSPLILGTEPIGKLLIQYSVPAIIAMTVTSLYNIIDSIFIGHGVGALAIAGLAITFPLMNLVVAFCTLVGIGGATISSIFLGQKDKVRATEVVHNVLIMCIINAVCFGGLTFLFLDSILLFFGASHDTLPYARDFMQVILLGTPITYVFIGLNNVMRATGYPRKAMFSSLLTVGCNIILAPIFIFSFDWGIRGAALATVVSQTVAMVWVLVHFANKKNFIHFDSRYSRLKVRVVAKIFSIGMSPFLMNVCACVVVIFINNALQHTGGDLAIGAYGIVNRTLMLFVMIVMGITQGMQPIVAMFTTSEELVDLSVTGLRISCAMFPFVGCQIVISNFFQSIGRAPVSIFLSLSRQLLFLLPLLLILPTYWSTNGVWLSMPISDFIAFVIAVMALWIHQRKIRQKFQTVQS